MIQQQISYNRQADFFFELINNQLWVHDLKDAVEYQSSEEITIYLTYEFRRGIYAFGFNEPSATKRYFTNNNKKRCYCIKLKGYRSIQFTRLFHFELYNVNLMEYKRVCRITFKGSLGFWGLSKCFQQQYKVKSYMYFGHSIYDDISKLQHEIQIVSDTSCRVFDMNQKKEYVLVIQKRQFLMKMMNDQIKNSNHNLLPKTQNIVVSTNLSQEILDRIDKFINNPLKIIVKSDKLTLEEITQVDTEEWKFQTLCDLYDILKELSSVPLRISNKMSKNQWKYDWK
ncbi:unnamed protein product [Paramecium pentaurelia]|uniref:Uncharacterized protein n=1 Tax=Paramecium pentaurelia TaxID=43138 RepID=A0A8S1WQ92_9CILI|nr:unnamed protein product [Paramecium pentaurelia]